MTLKDTIPMMESDDYKERFKAEYYQLAIRHFKLKEMIRKYREGLLGFEPNCPIELLEEQEDTMHEYLYILRRRAKEEGIDLSM